MRNNMGYLLICTDPTLADACGYIEQTLARKHTIFLTADVSSSSNCSEIPLREAQGILVIAFRYNQYYTRVLQKLFERTDWNIHAHKAIGLIFTMRGGVRDERFDYLPAQSPLVTEYRLSSELLYGRRLEQSMQFQKVLEDIMLVSGHWNRVRQPYARGQPSEG